MERVGTTMGFSTLDGLVMGTRPGWLDPGVLLYLIREKGYDITRLCADVDGIVDRWNRQ